MADRITREKRSDNMAKIRSRNTSIEIKFRKQLFKQGIRYLLNYPLYGKPDLTIPSKKIAIFVNGCFWHQHKNCKLSYMPKSRVDFWKNKLLKNITRDKQVRDKLQKDDWTVITVWECDIENKLSEVVNNTIGLITQ